MLLSKNFRYFGDTGTDQWKRSYPAIRNLVEGLGQGHRVNHGPRLRDELHELKDEMWQIFDKVKLGEPAHAWKKNVCHSAPFDEDETIEVTESGCKKL